jgi:hypothetical protein
MSNVSERRLAANRANAKKSTGPRTPEGKARSRMNALKHGLFASQLVLPTDPPESAAQLAAIRRGLAAEIRHAGPLERLLVEMIAASLCRLGKAYRCEAGLLHDLSSPDRSVESPNQTAADDAFRLLLRHEARLERLLDRCLERLLSARTPSMPLAQPAPEQNHFLPIKPTGPATAPVNAAGV